MLDRLGDSIWGHEQTIRFGGLPLRHRMSVIKLAGGGVVLHSPTHLDPALAREIQDVGPVVAVIAPSWWHDLFLRECLHAFPDAAFYANPTLLKWNRSFPFTDVLTNSPPTLWDSDMAQQHVEGIGLFLDEFVFYHRPSRSIIVADLLFNFGERDQWITRALAPVVIGPYPGCRFARLYRPFVLDRRRFRDSIERILQWDFDQIIVGHGDVVLSGGKDIFRVAFRWLLR